MSESEIVRNTIDNSANGYSLKNNLFFDGDLKKIRPSGYGRNPDSNLSIGPKDTDFSVDGGF